MASHVTADACKNGGLRAQTFNDASLLTATSNDLAFDEVFALPVAHFASRDLRFRRGSTASCARSSRRDVRPGS
jgi:hypothetical protein